VFKASLSRIREEGRAPTEPDSIQKKEGRKGSPEETTGSLIWISEKKIEVCVCVVIVLISCYSCVCVMIFEKMKD
jgi:hypothetical protein